MTQPTLTVSQSQLRILLEEPTPTIPPGALVEFNNPCKQHGYVIWTFVLGLFLTTTVVVLRIFTKMYLVRSVEKQDCEASTALHHLLR